MITLINYLYQYNILLKNEKINPQFKKILNKHPKLLQQIVNNTSFIVSDNIHERLHCLINDITSVPQCMCGNFVSFRTSGKHRNTYSQFCSPQCGGKYTTTKVQQTKLKKYNNPTFNNSQKASNTNLQRYGFNTPSKHSSIKHKITQTLKQINNQKYNVDYKIQIQTNDKLKDRLWLYNEHVVNKKSMTEIAGALDTYPPTVKRWLKYHNIPITNSNYSLVEEHIKTFLTTHDIQFQTNTRSVIPPFELDIWIPNSKIGIEINGIYWHSEVSGGKDKHYHNNKTILCSEKDIQLLHFWDIEILQQRNIIESMIESKLLITPNRIYARSCNIKEISSSQAKLFLNTNHIQKFVPSKLYVGLLFDDKLVALMAIAKNRFSKHNWEITRYCNVVNTTVVGGFGKCFSYIKKRISGTVISYANKRYSTGKVYERLGFELINVSPPNYFYTHDYRTLYSRNKFQKHKLSKKLPIFNSSNSEWTNMTNNGYDRIWDCGNLVYSIKI